MSIDARSITTAVKQVANVVMSDKGQKFLCGTYSNGEPRSVVDAMRDEYVATDDRVKEKKKNEKHKNKKKKKQAQICDSLVV